MCQYQFPTLTDLQRDTGHCPRSLTTGMVAGSSPTSCPTGGCVLIPSDWTFQSVSANKYSWFHASGHFSFAVHSPMKDLSRWGSNINV